MSGATHGTLRPPHLLRAGGRRVREAPRWRLLLAASGWLTWVGLLLPAGSPVRVLLVLVFVLLCPGLAVSLLVPIREWAVRWVLAVALSMSLALLLNTALTVVSNDSWPLRLAVLASITTIAALLTPPTPTPRAVPVQEGNDP
jgi:uncharacterized membrane protein